MPSIAKIPLKLYGVPLSQPFRSCAWTLLNLRVPFEIEMAVPGMSSKVGTKNENFQALTPHRSTQVPLLVDNNTGLVLTESPAIMSHACERYGTHNQLLAPSGSNQKALINSYTHWHHSNTRFLAKIFQTKVRPDLKAVLNEEDHERIQTILQNIDRGWLQSSPYIGESETPSVADILAYGEISTLTMTNLLKVDEFENLSSWMNRMTQLPFHDVAHAALKELGDLSQDKGVPIAKRLGPATKAGLKAFADAQQIP
ncbi:iron hydrogenase [Nitzschia inconspicua]|uniref:Iron hydrogenase n=1 Tax=Nitzschia inconspicua TaxID=303405 RepID=A0A9K3L1D7_9STRA|nr:iron hydrogenase [Nitzschia inconspicua]